jgi:hypothetical protein
MAIRTGADQPIAELEKKLKQARSIQRRINQLQTRLDVLVSGSSQKRRRGKRRMSAAARRRISEAQKRRWAKQRRQNASTVSR